MTITSHRNALPIGTMLMEYRLEGLLGAGAFGITYLARDTHLDKDVAIKEYLPSAFAARTADGSVAPITQQQVQDYQWGLTRFGEEARTLARFAHPNIVRVNRYFGSNGTGYMVMDYEQGESLKAFAQANPFPPESTVKAIVAPLLDGLERVHAAGFLHRDIKPDNIFLRRDGSPVLIDFGSARQALADSSQRLTTIVSPGYAPFEQYTTSKQQGPWSDIYSLGGVLYFLVTGENPPDAITRVKADTLGGRLGRARERYGSALIDAIAWSLEIEEGARPDSVASWRAALLGAPAASPAGGPWSQQVAAAASTTALLHGAGAPGVRIDQAESTFVLLDCAPEASAAARVDPAAQASRGWNQLFGHLLLIVVTAALGALIGELPAFQDTEIVEGRLTAAMLARWLGAAGAIAFLWLLGRGAALRFREAGAGRAVMYELLMPVITLLVLAIAYGVLQKPLGPALDDTLRSIYGWGFLLAVCACAVWLSMAVFSHAEPLSRLLQAYRQGKADGGAHSRSAHDRSEER
jgi:hypothetical protein